MSVISARVMRCSWGIRLGEELKPAAALKMPQKPASSQNNNANVQQREGKAKGKKKLFLMPRTCDTLDK